MGNKLDSNSIATEDNDDIQEGYEFRKNRRTRKRKEAVIKETIESGRLWDD